MITKYNILNFRATDKMSDLVSNNHTMFIILNRFGINMGFNDKTIAEVCSDYDVNVDTLLAISNLLTTEGGENSIDISKLSLPTLTQYLSKSHSYYLDYRLPEIRERLCRAMPSNDPLAMAVINYYDEYIGDVRRHMNHEEVIFKYVDDLLSGCVDYKFDIAQFADHHKDREMKLTELKNIIIKYYPTATTNELSSVIVEIFDCESLVSAHCDIEDNLLMPAIRFAEESSKK